jgi:regulator of nucleoside diphosphate kinase
MTGSMIMMTHDDHGRLRGLLDRMPLHDRRHFQDLQRELTRALRIAPGEVPADVVTMGSTVHLRELESDEPWTFTVCFPEEANAREGRISVLSPVGTAIIGCRVGDVVDWPVPDGKVRIRIESIAFQPEAAGSGARHAAPLEASS